MFREQDSYQLLLIEDNLGDVLLLEEYLHEKIPAPEITVVNTFEDAKELYKNGNNSFDVVLLDLTLPDLHGEKLIRETKKMAGDASVIVLTGYADIQFGIKSLGLGVSDYLLKDELSPTSLYKSIVYSISRNHISKQLQDSEKRYKELFQLSPQPMYLYCLQTLKFLDVNQAAIDHYGYSKKEFLSMNLLQIRPKEEIPKLQKAVQKARKGIPQEAFRIFRHQKKNGEIIEVEIRSNVVEYEGKKAEVVLANDITDRLRYIHAIEDQNKRLQEIAWTQSHVVRAPLARLMSLVMAMDTLEQDFGKDAFRKMIIDSAEELDSIIRDIVNKTDKVNLEVKKDG
ncbi:PAS domain S-box protein [Negadavirga shengliensis]|uniref:PAS domain S-box protein n=1 Tax=Negadavirga shengliensis TaxID=1389218 RepID=A0ABV9SW04_9BACT